MNSSTVSTTPDYRRLAASALVVTYGLWFACGWRTLLAPSKEAPLSETHIAGPIGVLVAGRFRIDRLVGSGGMASVYQATDVALGREVALKLFRSEASDPAETDRQRGEVAVLARLNHFALVTLFDAGSAVVDAEQRTFFVMEFVDGPDLRSRISAGRLPANEVAELGADLSEALHYVHSRGIIHRDIKPANMLLAPSDFPGRVSHAKLADFGIARLLDDTRLTATGAVLGTATYLSPEQALGETIGGATDVYSLGLVLLECLTGERAYPGTAIESAMARLQRQPEIPAELGPEWSDVLEAMLRRDPDERIGAQDAAVRLRELVAVDVPMTAETELFSPAGSVAPALAAVPAGSPDEAGTAATALLLTGDDVTEVMPARGSARAVAAPVASTDTRANPATGAAAAGPDGSAPAARSARRPWALRRRILLWVLIAVAIVVAGIVLVLATQSGGPPAATPPSYPAVDGDLGTHLQQLQESVTP